MKTTFITSTTTPSVKKQQIIYAEVVPGSPRNEDCLNFGICYISLLCNIDWQQKTSTCSCHMKAIIQRLDDQLIEFCFLKSSISPKTRAKHFQNLFFQIDDETVLPMELTEKLEMPPFTILAGKYPVEDTTEFLIVRF